MKTILVIEDDKDVQLLYYELLVEAGYFVITADNGEEGLEKLRSNSFDLVILDVKMPYRHGLDILEEIRKKNPSMPVIICTAYKGMEDDFVVSTSQVAAYMVKPFDIKDLLAKVEETIGKP
jgi:DNA-binding response OmpR family regulator